MEKRPLLLCTDPGIDDFIALSMVLARPEFDVLGMIALSGNVGLDVTVNNALLACELNGRSDIPVLAGSAKPLARRRALPATSTAKAVWGNPPSFTQRVARLPQAAQISFCKWQKNTREDLKFSRWDR